MSDINADKTLKPAGTIVAVGAIPGAVILTNNSGEVFAIDQRVIDEVIACMQRMSLFSKRHDPLQENFAIPVPNWPQKGK